MTLRSPVINVMVKAAEKAAKALVRDFGEVEQLQVSQKGPADFVSSADLRAEQTLMAELKHARPDYGFLMEESGVTSGSDPSHRWIVDPLDGTLNFLHGIPQFSISIALEQAGEIIAGVVLNPVSHELFHAEKGGGAFLNNQRLRVSGRRQLDHAVIAMGVPPRGRGKNPLFLALHASLLDHVAGLRRMGSAALDLAYVAAGRFDGFFEVGLQAWDIAAGLLLVREAGGFVSEIDGGREMLTSGSILAANDHLHADLGALLLRGARNLSCP